MTERVFRFANIAIAAGFTIVFCVLVIPALYENFDVLGAFAAGFVNPFASGYSADVFFCWAALAVWVRYEARQYNVRYGWVCLILGIVPGVAVGFALYLLLRIDQVNQSPRQMPTPLFNQQTSD